MTKALVQIAELIRQASGIQLQPNRYPALARRDRARRAAAPIAAAFLALAQEPVRGPAAVARLIDEVTVHESSFFREWDALDALSWRLLLAQAHARGSSVVRVWSAACSTGEEAYSLAIAACEAFAPDDPPVRILGTDIANAALDRAREGRYRVRPLRAVSTVIRSRYFTPEGKAQLAIGEQSRRLVEFRQHNLAHDPAPPPGEEPFDLILCRNVLIYLDARDRSGACSRRSSASVHPEGTLILGTADALCGHDPAADELRRADDSTAEHGLRRRRAPPAARSRPRAGCDACRSRPGGERRALRRGPRRHGRTARPQSARRRGLVRPRARAARIGLLCRCRRGRCGVRSTSTRFRSRSLPARQGLRRARRRRRGAALLRPGVTSARAG